MANEKMRSESLAPARGEVAKRDLAVVAWGVVYVALITLAVLLGVSNGQ